VVQGAIVTVSLPSMTHCPPRRKYKAGSHPPRQRRAPQARLARQESEDRQIGDLRLGTRRRPSGHFQCEYAPQRDRLAQARRPSRRHDGGGAMTGRNGDLLRQAGKLATTAAFRVVLAQLGACQRMRAKRLPPGTFCPDAERRRRHSSRPRGFSHPPAANDAMGHDWDEWIITVGGTRLSYSYTKSCLRSVRSLSRKMRPSRRRPFQCGENTPTQWTCKTWTYGRPYKPSSGRTPANGG
jgi:hypothetical protein